MFRVKRMLRLIAVLLTAICASKFAIAGQSSISQSDVRRPFSCRREAPPEEGHLSGLAMVLFDHAHHLDYVRDKRPFDVGDIEEFDRISRYYSIASAHGIVDATVALIGLQWRLTDRNYDGVATARRQHRNDEVERLMETIQKTHPSRGYLLQATAHAQAWRVSEALALYRRAADLGNPEAQYRLARYLDIRSDPTNRAFGARRSDARFAQPLYECAAQQGHGKAATAVALNQARDGNYRHAVLLLQQAVMAGDARAAFLLRDAFGSDLAAHARFGVLADDARYERYERARTFLIRNSTYGAKIPDLDRIVPLPPASLPTWDGNFEWEHAQRGPREPPSEALLIFLAETKGLDPQSGHPDVHRKTSDELP